MLYDNDHKAGSYGNGRGAGNNNNSSSANINGKKSGAKESQPQSALRDKATWHQPKPVLKAEGNYLKNEKKTPRKE